jgi:AraC-like DNA-binding protein
MRGDVMGILYRYNDEDIVFHHTLDEHPDPSEYTMHAHDRLELFFFLSGKGVFHVEGNTYELKSGDLLLFEQGESHYIELDPLQPYERVAIHFSKSAIPTAFHADLLFPFSQRTAGQGNLYRRSDFADSSVSLYLQKLIEPHDNPRMQITALLLPILMELQKAFAQRVHKQATAEETAVMRALRYINAHLYEPLHLEEISRHAFISKPQLCRMFKAETGSTVGGYITAKRLLRAKEMLDAGEAATVTAAACGFGEYTTFYRAFSRRYGYAPTKSGVSATKGS